jgi:hypothetical protein
MILQYEYTKDKYQLEHHQLQYIINLFNCLKDYTIHLKLINQEFLECIDCYNFSQKIMLLLQENSIYEYNDEYNELTPVIVTIDPSFLDGSLHPISNDSKYFLIEVAMFLEGQQRILINPHLHKSNNVDTKTSD